jgi:hypothetical protein
MDSLCKTCYSDFTRKWEKKDDPDTEFSESHCTIYPIKNVTHIVMTECNMN